MLIRDSSTLRIALSFSTTMRLHGLRVALTSVNSSMCKTQSYPSLLSARPLMLRRPSWRASSSVVSQASLAIPSQVECPTSLGFNLWSGYMELVAYRTPLPVSINAYIDRVLGLPENDALADLGYDDFELVDRRTPFSKMTTVCTTRLLNSRGIYKRSDVMVCLRLSTSLRGVLTFKDMRSVHKATSVFQLRHPHLLASKAPGSDCAIES